MAFAAGILLVGAAIVGMVLVGHVTAAKAAAAVPAAPGTAGGSAGSAAGVSPNAAGAMRYLQSQGLSRTAAAGVVGNLQQESGIDPRAPGGGLAQWIGDRWTALLHFAAGRGLSPDSMDAQLQFLVNDLHTSYSSLLSQLNAAASPGEAATLFSNIYERPGTPMLSNRINYANAAYQVG